MPDVHEPPRPLNADGQPRRVGVELEFAGLGLQAAAGAVVEEFGGRVEPLTDYECRVVGAEFGDFGVEFDSAYLKQLGQRGGSPEGFVDSMRQLPHSVAAAVGELVVPVEIVGPPVPFEDLDRLDRLGDDLRRRGARGTRHSLAYAFGMHLNPELPDLEARTLSRTTQAFLAAYDWLVRVEAVDWSRSVTPYIDRFPEGYVRHVLRPGYAPDVRAFVDDYLRWNPSRNRALDLLPLLTHLDESRVRAVVQDDRVKSRPTYHYRLPNCAVDEPGWGVVASWNRWVAVERLAEDDTRLRGLSDACLAHLDRVLPRLDNWSEEQTRWMGDDPSSA